MSLRDFPPAVQAEVQVDAPLTLAEASRIMREATRDKTYQLYPLGAEAAAYLRAKRKRLAASSYREYEGCLDKLAPHFLDLRLEDFEPSLGTERLEEFLEHEWGSGAPGTYNNNLSIVSDFFKWQVKRGRLHGDPTLPIERARKRGVYRTTFTPDQRRAIIASQGAPQRPARAPPAARLRAAQGLAAGGPLPALRPRPQAAHDLRQGRQGAQPADPRPRLLARPRAADPRQQR